MNKYRVIITETKGKELFNKVYEIPAQSAVTTSLIESQEFLDDLQESDISINDPGLKLDIYFESPLEFDQDQLIKEIQQELIYNNLDTEQLNNTIYELLEDIGLRFTPTNTMSEDLKASLINIIKRDL